MKYFALLFVLCSTIFPVFPQWQKQISGTTEDLNDVAVLNQTTAVVVGNNGTILKTTDSGFSWVAKDGGGTFKFNGVSFRDEQNGMIIGNQVRCITTDGGETWYVAYFSKNGITISYRNWVGNSDVIIGCDEGTILSSSDNGISWQIASFSNEPVIAADFNFSWQFLLAFAATRSFTAYTMFSTNLWATYQNPLTIEDDLTGGNLHGWVQYLIGVGGFAATPLILKKSWADTLWQPVYSFVPSPYIPDDISVIGDTLYVCGSNGKIFKSTNGGDDWFGQYTSTTETLNAADFFNNSIGYSVGTNGTILFTSNGGVSSVEKIQHISDYRLYQNYPNPFNPRTAITCQLPVRSIVTLKIYNLIGSEIATLVSEEKPSGTYTFEFDGSNLSSGVYLYKLTAGTYSDAKKMMLVR